MMKEKKKLNSELFFYFVVVAVFCGFLLYKQFSPKSSHDLAIVSKNNSSTEIGGKHFFPEGITLYLSTLIALPEQKEDEIGLLELSKRFKSFGLDLKIKKIEESKLFFDLSLQANDLVVLPAPYAPVAMNVQRTLFFLDLTEAGKVNRCFLNFFVISNKNNPVGKLEDISSRRMVTWQKHSFVNWFFKKNQLGFDKLQEVGLKHALRLDLVRNDEEQTVLIELGRLLESGKMKFRDRDPYRTPEEWEKAESLSLLQTLNTKVPCNYLVGGNSWSLEQQSQFKEIFLKVLDTSTEEQKKLLDKLIGFSHAEYARFDIDIDIKRRVFSWENLAN